MTTEHEQRRRIVLVPEAQTLGAIGVIRSLGRAGYIVIAMSPDKDALGFSSNFVSGKLICPSYESPEFIDWLSGQIVRMGVDLIVPSEAFLLAVKPVYDQLKHLMALPDDAVTAYKAFSKVDVTGELHADPRAAKLKDRLPPSYIVRRMQDVPNDDAIENLGGPFYVKADGSYNRTGDDAFLRRCETAADARLAIIEALNAYDAVLIEGHVPGVKAAIAVAIGANGQLLSLSGVLGRRTTPHTGGMMSMRESWMHHEMAQSARDWLSVLDWRGVAMVECKWDPETDEFWFIEINARYWGYLHLDLFAGVDVPRIQADDFFGIEDRAPQTPKLGVKCRHTFPGDAGWLVSVLKDEQVSLPRKLAAGLRFAVDFLDPTMKSDLLFPGDQALYWIEAGRYIQTLFNGLRRRLFGPRPRLEIKEVTQ